MKKLLFIAGMVLLTLPLFSQPDKVVSAYNYLKDGRLDKAKEMIDLAIVHPKTMNEPKTWLYKGNVYLAIALTENENYRKLHPDPLTESYNAYQKCIEINKDYAQPTANPPSPMLGLFVIGEQHYNKGVELYNAGKFDLAITEFEQTKKINSIFGVKDSLATFNAAICAMQIDDNDKAIQYLRELVTMNYNNPIIFSTLANLYKEKGEFEKAMQVVKGGKTKYPDDLNILISETNIYLAQGEIEKAQNALQLAVEKDPTNPILHFTIGSNYDQMSRNDSLTPEQRLEMMNKAEVAYQKAIELKPDYFDAYYNLGALFYNEGVRIFEIADAITDMKLYEVEKVKFEAMWSKSLPYLEKAHLLNPVDMPTLISLRTLYARLSMSDKLAEINAKIKALTE